MQVMAREKKRSIMAFVLWLGGKGWDWAGLFSLLLLPLSVFTYALFLLMAWRVSSTFLFDIMLGV